MSNDMKFIMEGWRKSLKEYDTGVGDFYTDEEGDSVYSLALQGGLDELNMFLAQVLDPTGISAWEDLSKSIDEFNAALDKQEDSSTLESMKENLINGFFVALNAVDSIPLAGYAVPSVKVLRGARKAFRKLTRKLVKIDPKLAKISDDIAIKLSRAESRAGNKSIMSLIPFLDSIEKALMVGLAAVAAGAAKQVYDGYIEKRDAVRRLKIKLWGDVIDKVYRPMGDPEFKEYLAPLKKIRMSWSDDRILEATPKELDNIEKFLNTLPQNIYETMEFKNRDGFLTYLERESARQINRELQKLNK